MTEFDDVIRAAPAIAYCRSSRTTLAAAAVRAAFAEIREPRAARAPAEADLLHGPRVQRGAEGAFTVTTSYALRQPPSPVPAESGERSSAASAGVSVSAPRRQQAAGGTGTSIRWELPTGTSKYVAIRTRFSVPRLNAV